MFGVSDNPVLLSGGEGRSFRAGNIVLKPTDNEVQVEWSAEVLQQIHDKAFRVNQPIKTIDGKWVYDGWQAFRFIEGSEIKGRWQEKISVSRAFHQQLHGIERPHFIGRRNTPWERADLIVWNDRDDEYGKKVRFVTDDLLAVKRPLQLEEQIIHGDMTGNILFDENLPPAIIDFSPYWRPAEYATAIIIVDAIVWEGAPDSILDAMENTFENNQLLIRATLWRIRTTDEFSRIHTGDPTDEIIHYAHLIELLKSRL